MHTYSLLQRLVFVVTMTTWVTLTFGTTGSAVASTAFPEPPKLKTAIQFWTDIFWQHDSRTMVLHDREHLGIIWQVVELPLTGDPPGDVDKEAAKQLITTMTEDLIVRLKRLAQGRIIDENDRVLLTLAGGAQSPFLKGAWERVRAQSGIADKFKEGIKRAKPLIMQVRSILRSQGVPTELSALPFIESGFNPRARSSAGAAGLWQLMPGTAKQYGLKISKANDERLDLVLATQAAARILKHNYAMLGTWPLAITGYNHGPYGIKRAVKSVGSANLMHLINRYKKRTWGFASKNFYAEFIAALHIISVIDETDLRHLEGPPLMQAVD